MSDTQSSLEGELRETVMKLTDLIEELSEDQLKFLKSDVGRRVPMDPKLGERLKYELVECEDLIKPQLFSDVKDNFILNRSTKLSDSFFGPLVSMMRGLFGGTKKACRRIDSRTDFLTSFWFHRDRRRSPKNLLLRR